MPIDINSGFGINGNEFVVTGDLAIAEAINNIIRTPVGTRVMNRAFGSNLESFLFQEINESTAILMMNDMQNAIERWEPRVIFDSSKSSITPNYEQHKYEVLMTYYQADTGEQGSYQTNLSQIEETQ